MTVSALKTYFQNELLGYYAKVELESTFFLLAERYLKLNRVDVVLSSESTVEAKKYNDFQEAIVRLKNYEPVQYILGDTEFYGLNFSVNADVLIPRPETEELVDCIIKESPKNKDLKILDIGTGSGCIAIALSKNLNNAKVYALDISKKALKVARKNANYNKVAVKFVEADILNWNNEIENIQFDVIVSNPPYVRVSEKSMMKPNVLDHEPHLALFVNDKDALLYYKHILFFAKEYLANQGHIYFEINEHLGQSMERLLTKQGFDQISLQQDLSGKDRIIRAIKA